MSVRTLTPRQCVKTYNALGRIALQTPEQRPEGPLPAHVPLPMGQESNWIKTLPGRGWFVWFRFYSPTEPFFDKTWQLPDFEKMTEKP
jgi:hypothetical protein